MQIWLFFYYQSDLEALIPLLSPLSLKWWSNLEAYIKESVKQKKRVQSNFKFSNELRKTHLWKSLDQLSFDFFCFVTQMNFFLHEVFTMAPQLWWENFSHSKVCGAHSNKTFSRIYSEIELAFAMSQLLLIKSFYTKAFFTYTRTYVRLFLNPCSLSLILFWLVKFICKLIKLFACAGLPKWIFSMG